MVISGKDFRSDTEYREHFLKSLNELCFKESIILCDIRLHATRRYLNDLNCNIEKVFFYTNIPEDDYLLNAEFEFVKKHFRWDENVNLLPQQVLKHELAKKKRIQGLPERYVVMHMGASKEIRRYGVKSFIEIAKYINDRGYPIVLIGAGEADEAFYEDVQMLMETPLGIISKVSQLSVQEALIVLYYAQFFVGTDSGMWNASYVLGKHSVVLYGGGEYGNFMHPDSKIHYVTVEDRHCFGCKWYCNNYDMEGHPKCIYGITPNMVINEIDKVIDECKVLGGNGYE